MFDIFLRYIYKTSDLWHEKVYKEVFASEYFKKRIDKTTYLN